jgi:aminoglycoside phosphotransferase (APT) family kinase protein
MLKSECALMQELRGRGLGVPEVYECSEADGKPAAVLQRITGPSLLENLARNPLRMGNISKTLARLHCEFLHCPALEGLMEIKERVDILIDRSIYLHDGDCAFIRSLLSELPEGNALLHGDFHPGNILTQAGQYYVIDWFGAARGDAVSDIAHTYLLCAYKPRIPSESFLTYKMLKVAAKRFGGMYLKQMRARLGFDMGGFGKWLAVRAAERTTYGQPSELKPRADFVKACRAMQEKGIPPERWYKEL